MRLLSLLFIPVTPDCQPNLVLSCSFCTAGFKLNHTPGFVLCPAWDRPWLATHSGTKSGLQNLLVALVLAGLRARFQCSTFVSLNYFELLPGDPRVGEGCWPSQFLLSSLATVPLLRNTLEQMSRYSNTTIKC